MGCTKYASFIKQVFYISQLQRKSHIQHNCELDDLWTGFEIADDTGLGIAIELSPSSTSGNVVYSNAAGKSATRILGYFKSGLWLFN